MHKPVSPGTPDTAAVRLPPGVELAPDERPLIGESFMLGTIVFYLHSQLVLTNRRLYAARPNTILGLIPVGTSRRNFPVENIAGVSAATRFNLIAFLLGSLAIVAGISTLSSGTNSGGGIGLIAIGVLLLLAAPRQAVEFMNSGGGTVAFPVSVFERGKTVEFANRVSEALARQPADRVVVPQATSAATANPTDAIRHLNRMREDGLITDVEYTAKRAEILARL